MKKRSLAAVILLPFVTFGIYALVWFVKTKGELNRRGAQIPTAWLMLIPFVGGLYWQWKYFEGAQQVTNNQSSAILNFLLSIFVTPIIPMALCQSAYNQIADDSGINVNPVGPESVPIPPSNQPPIV
ncbi:DUF4234 domain-containing protein [Candidatus Saccharibacteria bacterium]|jgi:hypothetical protein|nr:DUF4234 domain-containing protein [Candidatus Saccharibacteria bacterium]MBP9131581.1 DUF4234 domain-containing protein [Candidatus Saccharibacteria bacterium]